jgi:glucosamine-phosphate N-acetyltransferase
VEVVIRELSGHHVNLDLLETLASLREVELNQSQAAEVFRSRLRAGIRTYIALAGERVVGTLSLLIEEKFIHHGGRVGHIEDVAVHRDHQRAGIGRLLVEHATRQAAQLGCYKVILNCRPELVPFYERCGYHRHDVGMRIDLA